MTGRDSSFSLSINTNLSASYGLDPAQDALPPSPASPLSPASPRSPMRDRSSSTSQGVPPFRIPSTSSEHSIPPHRGPIPQGASRARHESRKLLSHVLGQLQRRPMPPSALKGFNEQSTRMERGLGAVVRSFAGIAGAGGVTENRSRRAQAPEDSDEDSADEGTFHTDVTLDLMTQLKDVLAISIAQGWDIFYEDADALKAQGHATYGKPRKRRRRSSHTGRGSRSRSRSASPSKDGPIAAPELLSQCVSILASVVAEDCKYQVSSPSPKRPPNALQSITLDIAQVLIYAHQHEPRIVSNIGFAMLPAFQTFRPTMHIRVLAFFEQRVLGGMLDNLSKVQGGDATQSPTAEMNFDEPRIGRPPLVSIQVDEVRDDANDRKDDWRRWSLSTDIPSGKQSTRAPEQPIAVYYLSSLVPPLLAAILEYVDLSSNSDPTTQRFHRLFRVLVQTKPDVYLDLLEAIAYHTSTARYAGLLVMSRYWPKAVGHVTLSKPIDNLIIDPRERAERRSSLSRRNPAQDHPYAHQFIPWRFNRPTRPVLFDGLSLYDCRVCSQRIEGFGVLCPFCMCGVHFDCYDYPDGSFFTEYSAGSNSDMRKVALHRFCHITPNLRDGSSPYVRKEQHLFRFVNTFSLSLCCVCHQPLWGYINQGLKCGSCRQFIHSSCLAKKRASQLPRCRASMVDIGSMTISYSILRQSFLDHYQEIILTEQEVAQRSYEEISVFHAILWMQLQILENGIALGSLVVATDGADTEGSEDGKLEEFELHDLVRSYETCLSTGQLPASNTLVDYLSENDLHPQNVFCMFDWNILAFISSTMKLPVAEAEQVSSESMQHLSVGQLNEQDVDATEENPHPYEIVTLAHLRDQLGDMLNLRSDIAARHLLTMLHHVGLLQRLDARPTLFDNVPDAERVQCCLPLPFGFDISVDVETLVAAIEACLSDIDLSVNETGFLLLTRRFWPNGMLSEYTFRRLLKAILGWILSEDNNLAIILRVYVAKSRDLPGVRSGEPQPWPAPTQSRPTATTVPGNGGDYVATRRALHGRYAAPWLLALHDQDITVYATMLFDLLSESAEEQYYWDPALLGDLGEQQTMKRQATVIDSILRYITKICQASVVFTVFDDLFQRWLERADTLDVISEPLPSLLRLLSLEADGSQRHTILIESRFTMGDMSSLADVSPLQVMLKIATTTKSGYQRGLRWLCLFASSGVDIPVPIFAQFASLTGKFRADLHDCRQLVTAALYASWLRPMGRLDLQTMMASLHAYLATEILAKLQAAEDLKEVFSFIRQSLAVCLLLYGCGQDQLLKLQMVEEDEIKHLPSRRKTNARSSMTMSDPVIVEPQLLIALQTYVERKYDRLSCMVAKFLNAYINGTPFVESFEVDNFILRNESALCACTWEFYGIQLAELASIRPALLVRTLVVDSLPFQRLLTNLLDKGTSWETRLETVLRLFRIVLDVTNPAFVAEDRQWGPSVIDIFHQFFSSIWCDDKEEIRTAVDTWSQTLLPAHFEAIARCWNEALSKAPVPERVKLVSFLLQLHTHFPTWKVLNWEVIIEAMLENDFIQKNGDDDDGAAAAHLSLYGISSGEPSYVVEVDPDLIALRVGLLSLSLRMVADGLTVDLFSLLRFKDQLVRALGYQDVQLVPSHNGHTFHVIFSQTAGIPDYAQACISDLMFLLDSAHPFDLPCSAMGVPSYEDEGVSSLLVGSLFVDVVIGLFLHVQNLTTLPPMTLKNLVKCLLITLQKHDFESEVLRSSQGNLRKAVRRSLSTLVQNNSVSHEIRQLALSTTHVFIKRCSAFVGNFIYEAVEEVVQLMISLEFEQKSDDLLVVQAKNTLDSIMAMFVGNGILSVLFRKPLDEKFFHVLRYVLDFNAKSAAMASNQLPLRDALLRDTLSRVGDMDMEYYQTVVSNLRQYVDLVHHARYGVELMQLVGFSLTNIARKTADWAPGTFDADPLLYICCTLIQHNKAQSRELLAYMETVLRAALVRSHVTAACLTSILQVTASFYRKIESREQALTSNVFASAVLELLSDALHFKSRLPSSTLAAAVEAVMESIDSLKMPSAKLAALGVDGVHYFHFGSAPDSPPQDFTASQAIAKMIMQIGERDSQVFTSLSVRPLDVRAWNILLLSALSRESSRCASLVLQNLQTFTLAYYTSLIPGSASAPDYAALRDIDISRAYVAIKLWLILARKVSKGEEDEFDTTGRFESDDNEAANATLIWNQLWPPFEMVLYVLEREARSTSSCMLAATSVADLFLFLHQFRSIISLEPSSHIALLNRLRTNPRVESKITRTLRSLNEPPPNVPMDFFVNQTNVEIVAEEKLLVEVAKLQDPARAGLARRIVS